MRKQFLLIVLGICILPFAHAQNAKSVQKKTPSSGVNFNNVDNNEIIKKIDAGLLFEMSQKLLAAVPNAGNTVKAETGNLKSEKTTVVIQYQTLSPELKAVIKKGGGDVSQISEENKSITTNLFLTAITSVAYNTNVVYIAKSDTLSAAPAAPVIQEKPATFIKQAKTGEVIKKNSQPMPQQQSF